MRRILSISFLDLFLLLSMTAMAGAQDLSAGCLSRYPAAEKILAHSHTIINWYPVFANAPEAMRREMRERGPADIDGTVKDGYTAWEIHWRWSAVKSGPPAVEYKIKVSLPCWLPDSVPDRAVVKTWENFLSALINHENNHILNFERYLPQVHKVVLTQQLSGKYEEEGNAAVQKVLENIRSGDREYDAFTGSGQKEGIKFP